MLTVRMMRQNADPDVRHDMETFLNTTVPEVRCGTVQQCHKGPILPLPGTSRSFTYR